MGARNYQINWGLNATQFLSEAAKVEAMLNRLHALAQKTGAALGSMPMQGGSAGWQTLLAWLQQINSQLQSLQNNASAAAAGMSGIPPAANATGAAAAGAAGGVQRLIDRFQSLIGIAAALGIVKKVVGEIGDAIKEAREAQEDKGKTALGYRERVRELSNLMGVDADAAIARTFEFGRGSGMQDWDKSREFLQGFFGSVPAAVQKGNVRPDQLQEVATESAIAARKLGIDEKTAGDMAGAMLMSFDVNNQVDDKGRKMSAREAVAGLFQGVAHGLNEGRGSITTLARSDLQLAQQSIHNGRLRDHFEAAAWTGVMSNISKTAAFSGTAYAQMEAGLFRQDGDEAKFLKRTGIDKFRTTTERSAALLAHLQQRGGQDWDAYLAKQGFGSRQERRSMIGGAINLDTLYQRDAASRAKGLMGREAVQAGQAYLGDRIGAEARANVGLEQNRWLQGREMEPYMIALQSARGRLEARGQLDSANAKILDTLNDPLKLAEWLGGKSELRKRLEDEMMAQASVAATNRGIDMGQYYGEYKGQRIQTAPTEKIFRDLDVMGGSDPTWRADLYGQNGALNNVPVLQQIGRTGGVDRGLGGPAAKMPPPRGPSPPPGPAPAGPGRPSTAAGSRRCSPRSTAGSPRWATDPRGCPRCSTAAWTALTGPGAPEMFWRKRGAPPPPFVPTSAPAIDEAGRRRDAAPAGIKARLGDGVEWTLAAYPPRIDGVWDRLYDQNLGLGKYDGDDLRTGALILLLCNYDLDLPEAWGLVAGAKLGDLTAAVEGALLYPGETKHVTRSQWLLGSMYANGLDPEAIPREHWGFVTELLIATKRTVPMTAVVSSGKYVATRNFLLGFIKPKKPKGAGDAAG